MSSVRFVVVEDDPYEAASLAKELSRHFPKAEVGKSLTEEAFLALLTEWRAGRSKPPDLIVLDRQLRWSERSGGHPNHLPARDGGLRCLSALRSSADTDRIPVVLYSVLSLEGQQTSDLYLGLVPKTGDLLPLIYNVRSLLAAGGHELPRLRGERNARS